MKPNQPVLRCFAKLQDDVWVAICVDLNLAAQGDTLEEAKQKLNDQVNEYVYDAQEGVDKAYASQLLNRKVPMSIMVDYHCVKVVYKICKALNYLRGSQPRFFNESLYIKHLV